MKRLIEVLSKRTDKPKAYSFMSPSMVGYGGIKIDTFTPYEFSISRDGKDWTSCFDVPSLDGVYCTVPPDVQPANRTNNLRKIGLRDGSRIISTTYDTRDFTMAMLYEGVDETDAMVKYDALQQFLISREAYWICFSNWRHRMYYVLAKMEKPTYTNEKTWTCNVTFTDLYGLSRSIGTSQDYPDDVWGIGNGMPKDVDPQYTFNTNMFSVYNLSNILIDPDRRGHPFKMILDGHSDGNLTITNKTTGDKIVRSGAETNGQHANSAFDGQFVIDGVRETLNGKSDTMNCSADTLTLQIGKNDFQIDNFSGTIKFDFPMWWFS